MHIECGVLREDLHCSLFVLLVSRCNPKQESARVELALEMMRVLLGKPQCTLANARALLPGGETPLPGTGAR